MSIAPLCLKFGEQIDNLLGLAIYEINITFDHFGSCCYKGRVDRLQYCLSQNSWSHTKWCRTKRSSVFCVKSLDFLSDSDRLPCILGSNSFSKFTW